MLDIIYLVSWSVFIMFIWFNTNAFTDYILFFKLDKYFYVSKWNSYLEINPKIGYLSYIRIKHNNFITKLISCKLCLLFWIIFILIVIFKQSFILLPIIYITSYVIYKKIDKI